MLHDDTDTHREIDEVCGQIDTAVDFSVIVEVDDREKEMLSGSHAGMGFPGDVAARPGSGGNRVGEKDRPIQTKLPTQFNYPNIAGSNSSK